MKNKTIILLLLALSLFLPMWAYAKVDEELAKVWKSLGGEMVTNGASYYKGQRGGHYTMGSMYFARERNNRPLISVNPPEIDFDKSCYSQGVLNFGGVSFISGDELKNKLQGIAQQAGMMFVYLGISAISPVIGETLQEVYSKLQEIGGFLSNECQSAKQIVGFIGDKLSQHSALGQDIFTKFKTGQGSQADLSSAYKEYPKGKSDVLKKAAAKDERMIIEDVNLAWKALEKLKIKDKELKEFMMTISGTLIIKSSGDEKPRTLQYIASKVTDSNILEGMLKGGRKMIVLKCLDEKCLSTTEGEKEIKEAQSFEHKVAEYFDKFKKAIKEDEELDLEAQSFLSKSGLPIFKMYDVIYSYTSAQPEFEQGLLIEVVAWNVLYNYLADVLRDTLESANNLQISAPELKDFQRSLFGAQKLLADFEVKGLSRQKLQLFLVKRAENFESTMANETAGLLNMV